MRDICCVGEMDILDPEGFEDVDLKVAGENKVTVVTVSYNPTETNGRTG